MPRTADGQPLEVLLNPLGIISRTNPSQMVESALGKIAAQTGKPYKVTDFEDIDNLAEYARKELAKHGLSDLEDVIDPETERKIPQVAVGNRFFMKLHHTAESKSQGRGMGAYTMTGEPAKGGPEGCFVATQRIMTIDGPVKIGRLCEKKLGVQVRTFSESLGEWVYRPVTDWFVRRARVEDVLRIDILGPCESHGNGQAHRYNRHTIYPTKNHEVCLFDGRRVLAGDLRVGDELTSWGPVMTADQRHFMLGTLLGDASATNSGFSFEHSVKQINYIDWKRSVLAGLCPNWFDEDREYSHSDDPKFASLNGRRKKSRVVYLSHPHIHRKLRAICYGSRGKRLTAEWLAGLNGLSVAVWLLDDGSITNRAKKKGRVNYSGNIATHGFSRRDTKRLAGWLSRRYNAGCTVNCENALTLSAELCRSLILEVARWVPWEAIPRSKKFLMSQVQRLQREQPPAKIASECRLGRIPAKVLRIKSYRPDKAVDEVNVYDFTVQDTHTYCAGPVLVSNSKRISLLDVNALLSHGATGVLRDASTIRGQRNEDFWTPFMQGYQPPRPKVPMVYEKFLNELKASGINVVPDGNQLHILALTDRDVDQLAGARRITKPETVRWDGDLRPIPGGLFDAGLTGGHHGGRWAAIDLHEPLPNPVMEEPIRRLLGLTEDKFHDVLAGRHELNGMTGPQAIRRSLDAINVPRAIEEARAMIASGKKTYRDMAQRRLGYLLGAQKHGLHPRDWMLSKAPVLPPAFRPVSVMSDNRLPLVADANYLYKELIHANDNLKHMAGQVDDVGEERLATYNALKAVTGLGDPVQAQLREKNVRGLLKHIFGSSPKFGAVQRRLISSTVDLVGRAVVTPDPNLDMDHVGLPENRAWDVYRNFIIRRLRRRGMPVTEAIAQAENRTPLARQELLAELDHRPVIVNRAPILHRFGIMAFWPRLTQGDTLRVSPLVVKGFNMDFDGDTSQYHVPVEEEARLEAIQRMLPSRNLISPADFKTPVHAPMNEYIGGLNAATQDPDERRAPRTFATRADAIAAYKRGDLSISDPVRLLS